MEHTKLEKFAIRYIKNLILEAQDVVLKNNENMGDYSSIKSGFGMLHEKLRAIEELADALLEDRKQ